MTAFPVAEPLLSVDLEDRTFHISFLLHMSFTFDISFKLGGVLGPRFCFILIGDPLPPQNAITRW